MGLFDSREYYNQESVANQETRNVGLTPYKNAKAVILYDASGNLIDSRTPYDSSTGKYASIDTLRNLRVAQQKRIIGSGLGAIDTTYLYDVTVFGTGGTSSANSVSTLSTGATANSTVNLKSKGRIRYLSGRMNVFRLIARFADTGTANNVREFGIYVDSNNQFVFRLSESTFSVVCKRAGVETIVSSGSFNGNGSSAAGTYAPDINFHAFEIFYTTSKIRFLIDDQPIHVFSPTIQSLVSSVVGNLYASNANSGGSTSNVSLDVMAWSASYMGSAVNNPNYYNINATAETRTLKSGGGTLQSISIGRTGGANCTLTVYDNTAGSGTIIGVWDINATQSVGTHILGVEGVNFYNGLTYVSSGTWTNGSVTMFWE